MTSFYDLVSSGLVISQKIRVDTHFTVVLWFHQGMISTAGSDGQMTEEAKRALALQIME